jgi:hypothetical protein
MGAPSPNFLSSSKALSNSMRLSLKKAAHAALCSETGNSVDQVHFPAPFPSGENVVVS